MKLVRIEGWWCPRCKALMMVKKRNGEMVECDCVEVQYKTGVYAGRTATMLRSNLKMCQRFWRRLYVESSPIKGEI